ncbi:hypothetical protein Tco_1056697 [Tanacetum coccineum]|uniref:Uncharacterized protein n=1 Tax=Tanacetum coccineum TaxID=301880 RepID=A0ABQ5H395_9ASTR
MSTLAENVLAVGVENRPPMLEKGRYDTWQSRMLLYVEGKEHGEMFLDFILKGPFQYKVVDFPANEALGIPDPEWTWFVTGVKQANKLHKASFDQLYAYLKQNEPDANEVRAMKTRFLVIGKTGLAIKEPVAGIFLYNGNFDLVFQRRSEYHVASTTQLIRIQNLVTVDSEYAHQVYDELIYEIESRPDVVQAREIVAKNLDDMN